MDVMTGETREVVEAFYSALEQGALKKALSMLRDDFIMEQPPYLPYGGAHIGAAGLVDVLRSVREWVQPGSAAMEFLVVEGDRAVACARTILRANGRSVTAIESWVVRDSQLAHCRVAYVDPAPLMDALAPTSEAPHV